MSEELMEGQETEVSTVGEADVKDLQEAQEVEVVDEQAGELRAKAKEIRVNMERAYFEIAEVIHEILSNDYFRFYGYESLWDYVEDELDIKKRTAQYLISIFEFLKKLKEEGYINEVEELKTIGWTKVKELVSVVNTEGEDENLSYWIDQAKQCSSRQLEDLRKEYVASQESEGEGEDDSETKSKDVDKKTSFSVKLYSENYSVFNDALELAKQKTGKEDKETLLVAMSSAFLASEAEELDERLNNLETTEGIRLIAVKDGQIVFGEDVIDEVIGDDEEEAEGEETEVDSDEEDTLQL